MDLSGTADWCLMGLKQEIASPHTARLRTFGHVHSQLTVILTN